MKAKRRTGNDFLFISSKGADSKTPVCSGMFIASIHFFPSNGSSFGRRFLLVIEPSRQSSTKKIISFGLLPHSSLVFHVIVQGDLIPGQPLGLSTS
jgi:hypothetical protein